MRVGLREALAQLPADEREAFLLREVGGLSYDEIAAATDSTMPAGFRAAISAIGVLKWTTSEYTDSSRRRRAINWVYCEPKSRTMMV